MTRRSRRLLPLLLLGLPLAGHAATVVAHCGMTHFVRNGGTEMASTAIAVRNADPVYTATVVVTKDGSRNHLSVGATPRIRERVFDAVTSAFRETTTRSSSNSACDLSAN